MCPSMAKKIVKRQIQYTLAYTQMQIFLFLLKIKPPEKNFEAYTIPLLYYLNLQ